MHGFTDLEDRLLGANGGAALQASLASLRAIAEEARAGIARGLSREDFVAAEKVLAAVAAAELILLKPVNLMGS